MQLNLVWSGQKSKAVAKNLEWLFEQQPEPPVLRCRSFGPESYPPDDRAQATLRSQGIALFCLTPENAADLWLSYRAGYLAAINGVRRLACLRHEVEDADVRGPLAKLRSFALTPGGLIEALSQGSHAALDPVLLTWLEAAWPGFQAELDRFLSALSADPAGTPAIADIEDGALQSLTGRGEESESLSMILGAPVAEIVLAGSSYREQKRRCELAFTYSVLYRTLRATEGNLPRTAAWLELNRGAIFRLAKRSGLSPRNFRPQPGDASPSQGDSPLPPECPPPPD